MAQTSIQFTPSQLKQLADLKSAGYGTQTRVVSAALDAYYNHFLSQQEITILSKKAAEVPAHPEVVTIDGLPWLNLGSGLLADAAAEMISAQFPDVQKSQNNIGEWFIYEKNLADDHYAALRVIMIFKVI